MKLNNKMHASSQKVFTGISSDRFPIRILSDKTGVGTSTLRAWERRYGLLHPARTPKGHRLYNEHDTQRIFKIIDLLNDGHSLPVIAEMLSVKDTDTDYTPGMLSLEEGASGTREMSSIWENFIQSTLASTCDFNIERIDAIYNEASSLYPIDMVTERLIQPTLSILGEAWKKQPERGIAEEHFYSSWLKNRLGARFHHAYTQARGARIVCACAPGSYHEIGLVLFSLSTLSRGYRVLYFGADLPFDQLPHIVQRSAARAVIISVQGPVQESLDNQLSEVISKLKTPVFIGGSNPSLDPTAFEAAGGILLGANISVALRVFESHVPAFPPVRDTDAS